MQRRTKRWIIMMVCALLMIPAQFAWAGEVQYVNLELDNQPLSMDVKPYIDENQRTIVPISFVSTSMGYDVLWHAAEKKVSVSGKNTDIELEIGSKETLVNNQTVMIDTKAIIVEGRTMVPLRFVMEQMGATVGYESSSKTVMLTSPQQEEGTKVVDKIRIQVSTVLNVRTSPRTDQDNVIGKAENGSIYSVEDTTEGWYEIDFNGKNGWVSAEYCAIEKYRYVTTEETDDDDEPSVEDSNDEDEIPVIDVKKVQVDVSYGSSLHVRESASMTADILGRVVRGDTFNYLGKSGDWYKIEYANTTGYVHQDYAKLIEVQEIDYDNIEAKYCKINSPVVNVRSTPEVMEDDSNKITQVLFGSTYDIVDSTDEWYAIELENGKTGWLVKRAVDLLDSFGNTISSDGIELKNLSKIFIIDTDDVNIRKGPDKDYDKITSVDEGAAFKIMGTSGDWYKISLQDGRIGYVASWLGVARSEIRYADQIEERDRKELAEIEDIDISDAGVVVESNEDLLYEVFVLDNPNRAMIQFYDVTIDKDFIDTVRVGGDKLEKVEIDSYGESGVRIVLHFDGAASLDVAGDAKKGQEEVTFTVKEALLAGKTIVIDPGHGAYKDNGNFDVGATSPSGIYEYIVNNDIGMDVANRLIAHGANVILTHDDGKLINMDLDDRVKLANAEDADIFVSIHSDSFPENTSACGMATYYYHGNGNIDEKIDLATEVQNNLALYTGRPNNGIKLRSFFVIKNTDMPSILVEVGFLSNPVEEKLLQTSSFRSLAAEGIVNGILTYFER
ncbi:N-acetylmuramoyl-L-alanine amidase [Clostridia bacterium]|nr:N-acetylmuramoyl-L-alanine amidase [Clostridia bacterium]